MILINALFQILDVMLTIYMALLLLIGVLRMAGANERLPFVRGIAILTDPPADWLRRRFPKLLVRSEDMHVDLSPFILILLVIISRILVSALRDYLNQTIG